ncbi:hypothetical protein SAMN05880574_1235 [Chryseobacterium sp. RU37D]|uniref:DUF7674 family protein n=1 Tax=Chryseobacterium sp. RU37D TaxID=1907397 RepID=UPI000954EECB|nr:hypothetical protein [Chryseobacterium sp. RU37D]SIQ73623.1 hypothetical protein SAMN05880574_1235 [Chryseobacterium sp. RU37D]
MNYLQAVQEITNVIPDIQKELHSSKAQNAYNIIQIFTERIKNMIRQNDRNILFKCLEKIDYIYENGDNALKNAIENTFIYSLDNSIVYCSHEYRKMIFSHISRNLQKSYLRQIYNHGV